MLIGSAFTTFKTIDLTNPQATPAGATFLPSLLAPIAPQIVPGALQLVLPFADLTIEWDSWLKQELFNRKLLTSASRYYAKHYLQNPDAPISGSTPQEKASQAKFRYWALNHLELQDNQVYHKQLKKSGLGQISPSRYHACTYDAIELIQRTHISLGHASMHLYCFIIFFYTKFYVNL